MPKASIYIRIAMVTKVMSSKQLGFGDHEQTTAKLRTKRGKFLAEMAAVVPWQTLIALIGTDQSLNIAGEAIRRCVTQGDAQAYVAQSFFRSTRELTTNP
jgi:hypothetical protein